MESLFSCQRRKRTSNPTRSQQSRKGFEPVAFEPLTELSDTSSEQDVTSKRKKGGKKNGKTKPCSSATRSSHPLTILGSRNARDIQNSKSLKGIINRKGNANPHRPIRTEKQSIVFQPVHDYQNIPILCIHLFIFSHPPSYNCRNHYH